MTYKGVNNPGRRWKHGQPWEPGPEGVISVPTAEATASALLPLPGPDARADPDTAGALGTALAPTVTAGGPTGGASGLVKGNLTRNSQSGATGVSGFNPEVKWKDLQQTEGGAISGSGKTLIDGLLAAGTKFRLRLLTGAGRAVSEPQCPSWLLAGAGTWLAVNPQSGFSANCPKWWTTFYKDAYADLHTKLAALWDGDIKVVFSTGGMTIFAEPCIKGLSSSQNRTNLNNAGYTIALDKAANTSFANSMTAWGQTNVGYAYNPYQFLNTTNLTFYSDEAYSRSLMETYRSLLGARHIIQNNSIRSSYIDNPGGTRPYTSLAYSGLYTDIVAMGPPVSFQTATLDRVGDLNKTLLWAIDMAAHAAELPGGFETATTLTEAQRIARDADLKAN